MRCKDSAKDINPANISAFFSSSSVFFHLLATRQVLFLFVRLQNLNPYELDARCRLSLYGKTVRRQIDDVTHVGDSLFLGQQVTCQCLVIIAFRNVEMEALA